MSNTFYIMDSFILPSGYNHMFMLHKIARGFEYHGFRVKIITHINEIIEPGFVMISDHPLYYSFGWRHNPTGNKRYIISAGIQKLDKRKGPIEKTSKFLQRKEYRKLAKQIRGKEVTVIAWSLCNEKEFFDKLGLQVIHSFDFFNRRPIGENQFHKDWYNFCKENENAIPLRFAADVNPSEVGKGCINEKYKLSFIGDKGYAQQYLSTYGNDKECKIIGTPPWITEAEKVEIYKNSKINLGLHNRLNRMNGMVGERVFEALAFGAVCLTDSQAAEKMTKGIAIYIKDIADLQEKVERLDNNPKIRKAIRKKGFDYIRKDGTWAARAEEFIRLSDRLYKTDFGLKG